ncbi:MAG: hypothetical protein IJ010_06290 [Ruminococcus sp.]|nr:hypothetical protein [Ruminococcus sp.]
MLCHKIANAKGTATIEHTIRENIAADFPISEKQTVNTAKASRIRKIIETAIIFLLL